MTVADCRCVCRWNRDEAFAALVRSGQLSAETAKTMRATPITAARFKATLEKMPPDNTNQNHRQTLIAAVAKDYNEIGLYLLENGLSGDRVAGPVTVR